MLTKLNEVYKDWATGDGVFTDLNEFNVPWKNETGITSALNMSYHGAHSGDKNISPVVNKFLSIEDENAHEKLANIIFTMFGDKWSKLWAALEIEYNPLSNYDMVETETINETADNTTTRRGTDTLTQTGTDNVAHSNSTENEVSAFNSSGYVDSTQATTSASDNETRNLTDTTTHNTTDDTDASRDVERELTRTGNIGVTTSQQMLQSEIELRKWLYYQSVFNDIDSILTLSIY